MRSFNERFFFINIIVLIPKDVIFLFNIYKPNQVREIQHLNLLEIKDL